MNEARAIKDFMYAMDQRVPDLPIYPEQDVVKLRISLVQEEVAELLKVLYHVESQLAGGFIKRSKLQNLVDIADAVADCTYVIIGTALTFGLDAERVFEIVHAANMAKAGGPVREDGKRLKPEGWIPPEPQITDLITGAWANAAPTPVVQDNGGVAWEGPQVRDGSG